MKRAISVSARKEKPRTYRAHSFALRFNEAQRNILLVVDLNVLKGESMAKRAIWFYQARAHHRSVHLVPHRKRRTGG